MGFHFHIIKSSFSLPHYLQFRMDRSSGYSARTRRRKIKAKVEEHLRNLQQEVDSENGFISGSSMLDSISETELNVFDHPSDIQLGNPAPDTPLFANTTHNRVDRLDDSSASDIEERDDEFGQGDMLAGSSASDIEERDDEFRQESDSGEDRYNTREHLANWATTFNITHAALKALLYVLKESGLHDLPIDPRTLLATPIQANAKEIAGGLYHHFGVENSILRKLMSTSQNLDGVETLTLHINIDGLPLFKSSGMQLWPILGIIKEIPGSDPIIIGVFSGMKKPSSVDEFLDDFVKEMKTLTEHGMECNRKRFKIVLDAFICDAPGRAFIKCIKYHSGYNACERCTQSGIWAGKMTFPEMTAPARTDVHFNEMNDEGHHTSVSPLQQLNIGMVSQFVLDYMHLVCLGVVRRLIFLWMKGPLKCRISCNVLKVTSDLMLSIRKNIPREFSRKPRSLLEVNQWKATEFRQFLLYTGPVVLNGKLPNHLYRNFMLLSVSIRFLLCPTLCLEYCDYAKELLVNFVKNFSGIYGEDMLIYNVHCLTHLAEDAKKYGALDNISAFPYENFLGKIKKMVRKPQNPLSQIVRRIGEKQRRDENKMLSRNGSSDQLVHKKPHLAGPLPKDYSTCIQYKECHGKDIFIACSEGDNCFEVNGTIVVVENILQSSQGETYFIIEEFDRTESFFHYPIDSLCLRIALVSKLSGRLGVVTASKLSKKMVLLPFKDKFVALPQLHRQ